MKPWALVTAGVGLLAVAAFLLTRSVPTGASGVEAVVPASRAARVFPSSTNAAAVRFRSRQRGRVALVPLGSAPGTLALAAALGGLREAAPVRSDDVLWSDRADVPHQAELPAGAWVAFGLRRVPDDQLGFVALIPPLRAGATHDLGDVERVGLRVHVLVRPEPGAPPGDAPAYAVRLADALTGGTRPQMLSSCPLSATGYACLELPQCGIAELGIGRGVPAAGRAAGLARVEASGVLGPQDAMVFVEPQSAARPGTLTIVAASQRAKWQGTWPEARLSVRRVDRVGHLPEPVPLMALQAGEQKTDLLLPEGEYEFDVLPQGRFQVVPGTARVSIAAPGWQHELWLEERPADCELELGLEPDGAPGQVVAVSVYLRPAAVSWQDEDAGLFLGAPRWRALRETVSRPADAGFVVATAGNRRWLSRAPVTLQPGAQWLTLAAAATVVFETEVAVAGGGAAELRIRWEGGEQTLALRPVFRWQAGVLRPGLRGTVVVPRGQLEVLAGAGLTLQGGARRTITVAAPFVAVRLD